MEDRRRNSTLSALPGVGSVATLANKSHVLRRAIQGGNDEKLIMERGFTRTSHGPGVDSNVPGR